MTKAEQQGTGKDEERPEDVDMAEPGGDEGTDSPAGSGDARSGNADEETRAGVHASDGDQDTDLRRELTTLNDRHLRLAAEFDNYRKRTERERRDLSIRSQGELAATLLDALDDLERMAGPDASGSSAEVLLDGVRLVERKLMRTLEGAGLERIDAEGATFDPATMEALMTTAAETAEEDDRVDQVFQPGYRFRGQLLRPARVRVKQYEG